MKNKYVFTAVLLLLLTAAGAGMISLSSRRPGAETDGTYRVVTSFYPVYIAAMNVIGDTDGVVLENMTEPQTGCLHDYQMTPEDMIALSGADLFVINGGGIESFIGDVTENYPELTIAVASEGITYLEEGSGELHDHEDGTADDGTDEADGTADETGHDHGDLNAHVWMDVSRYEQEVENIADALCVMDPAHEENYRGNAKAYREKLQSLKEELSVLQGKAEGRKIIIFHDAFAYFADAFGLEIAGIIDMDENTSLSANQISEIVEMVNSGQVEMLFTEAQYGTKIADAISRETDASVYVLDSLVTGEDDPDSYIRGMEANLAQLEEAFGEGEQP